MLVTADTREGLILSGRWMALRATRPFPLMFAGVDPEVLLVVVERGRQPCRRGVARCAVVTELQRHVVRVRGNRKIGCMTLVAVDVRQLVIAVDVALDTRRCCVGACQGEVGRSVIE